MHTPIEAEGSTVLPTTSALRWDYVDEDGVIVTVSVDTLRLGCLAKAGFDEWAEEASGFKRTEARPHTRKTAWHIRGIGRVEDYQYASGASFLNFEFRPNEDDPWDVLRTFLTPIAARRVDVALDYGTDLSGYTFDARRLQRTEHRSSSGKLVTLYLGSPKSGLRLRVYDKSAEAGLPAPLWRIEAQLRGERAVALPENLFDALVVRSGPAHGELKWSEAASLAYAKSHVGIQRAYSTRTRNNVEALLDQYTLPLTPSPSLVYRACLPTIKNAVASIVTPSDDCVAAVVS